MNTQRDHGAPVSPSGPHPVRDVVSVLHVLRDGLMHAIRHSPHNVTPHLVSEAFRFLDKHGLDPSTNSWIADRPELSLLRDVLVSLESKLGGMAKGNKDLADLFHVVAKLKRFCGLDELDPHPRIPAEETTLEGRFQHVLGLVRDLQKVIGDTKNQAAETSRNIVKLDTARKEMHAFINDLDAKLKRMKDEWVHDYTALAKAVSTLEKDTTKYGTSRERETAQIRERLVKVEMRGETKRISKLEQRADAEQERLTSGRNKFAADIDKLQTEVDALKVNVKARSAGTVTFSADDRAALGRILWREKQGASKQAEPAPAPKKARGRGNPITDEEKTRLRSLRAKGLSVQHCADLLGRSASAVSRTLVQMEKD